MCGHRLGSHLGAEGGGKLGEHGVKLDGGAKLLQSVVNGADADTLAAGVGFNIKAGAGLAEAEQKAVKLAVARGDGGGDGGEGGAGIGADGVLVGGQGGIVGQMAGGDAAVIGLGVVVIFLADGEVGQVALLLLAGHEGVNGVGDLAAVENGAAGAVEILGGGTEVFVNEKIHGGINHQGTGAHAVTVKGTGDTGAELLVLVNACLELRPNGGLAGGDDLGVVLAGRLLVDCAALLLSPCGIFL